MRTSILLIGLAASCTFVSSPQQTVDTTPGSDAETDGPSADSDAPSAPLPGPTEPRYSASYIMFRWSSAEAPPRRSPSDALSREALARTRIQGGEAFEHVAREVSDHPSGRRGGALGTYETGTMDPAFERAVASVAVGELAPVVQTQSAVYLIRRDAVREARVRILTLPAGPDAVQRATEARNRLIAGEPMDKVAADFAGTANQAKAQRISRGQLLPVIERAALKLQPKQVSEWVESPMGLHVIQRAD